MIKITRYKNWKYRLYKSQEKQCTVKCINNIETTTMYKKPTGKWAATSQNQQCGCTPSEDSDQPGHPPSQIRVFAVRMKKAWVLSYLLSVQRRLWSVWVDAQADLSLRWAHMPFCRFCHVMSRLKCYSDSHENQYKPLDAQWFKDRRRNVRLWWSFFIKDILIYVKK